MDSGRYHHDIKGIENVSRKGQRIKNDELEKSPLNSIGKASGNISSLLLQ